MLIQVHGWPSVLAIMSTMIDPRNGVGYVVQDRCLCNQMESAVFGALSKHLEPDQHEVFLQPVLVKEVCVSFDNGVMQRPDGNRCLVNITCLGLLGQRLSGLYEDPKKLTELIGKALIEKPFATSNVTVLVRFHYQNETVVFDSGERRRLLLFP